MKFLLGTITNIPSEKNTVEDDFLFPRYVSFLESSGPNEWNGWNGFDIQE